MKKAIFKFQSKDFEFPKNTYIGCISIKDSNNKKHSLFLTRVFENLDILKRYVLFVIEDLSDSTSEITPLYNGFFIKCNLSRLFPLNKTHWGGKLDINTDILRKFRNDVNIIKFWKMSEVLVTPDGEIDGVEFFRSAFHFLRTLQEKMLIFI